MGREQFFGSTYISRRRRRHCGCRHPRHTNDGSIHTRVSPAWDLATALRFMTLNLEYSGLFSIEAYGHDAVRNIYNIVLDTN